MRRTLVFLTLLTAMVTQIAAQQVLYFHYKNGQSFACEVSDISFITYDKSPGSDDYDIQVIYFKDNTSQEIPFSKVDSVGFNAPAPVLKDNAVVLDASFEDYIIKGDTVSFTMRKDTPASKRPKVGNVVGSTFDNEVFADGIIARVTGITETAEGINYTCEKATIEDVYDEIFYYGYGNIYQDPETNAESAPQQAKSNLEMKTGIDLWKFRRNVSTPQIIFDDYTGKFNTDFGTTGRVKMYLHKPKGGDMYARFNICSDMNATVGSSMSGRNGGVNVTKLLDLPLGIIATPIPVLFFKPSLQFGFYNEAFAELRYTSQSTLSYDCEFQVTYEKGQWDATTLKNDFTASIDQLSLSLNGWYGMGFEPKLFLSVSGTQTGVSLAFRGGMQLNANFEMDFKDYLEDGSLYSAIKDSKLSVTIPVKALLGAQAGLFSKAAGVDITFLTLSFPLFQAYFVPNINYASVDDLGSGRYHAVAAISPRDLLPWEQVELGFGVFDDDNKLVEKTYLVTYSNQNKPNKIETTFNLESGRDYKIAPLLKLFGYDVRADRSTAVVPGEAVDLGLSVKWSSTNLGADAIYKVGDAYYWGTLIPSSNYDVSQYNPITHDFYDGIVPHEISGMSAYDPCLQWGKGWRLPTKAEWEELIQRCTFEAVDAIPRPDYDAQYITWGVKVTGPNGNHIYIPANVAHWTGTVNQLPDQNPVPWAAYFATYVMNPDVEFSWKGGIQQRYLIRPVCAGN